MLLLIISFLIIAAYTAAVCIKQKGVPYSISATFYAIEHKWWFRFTMWACPMMLMPAILEASKPGTEFLAFLALAGMIVVGCFPDYKADKFQHRGHVAGATMAVLFSQLWIAFNNPWLLLIWAVWLIYTVVYMFRHVSDSMISDFIRTRPMFWVEVAALIATCMVKLLN